MDWINIMRMDNDEEKTIAVYDKIYEETRLNVSNSASIEFFTTTKYIEQIISNGCSILELGAGTGHIVYT